MAEEAAVPVAVDANKPVDEPARPIDAAESAEVGEEKPSDSGEVPADAPVEEQAPATAAATDDQIAKDEVNDAKPDTVATEGSGDAAVSTVTNGTPASAKKGGNNRRKSTGGVPEHKSKKTPSKKKKAAPELHLDTKPGDMWLVAMRGYQPWPVIIADDDMLPESLLAKRPVSAIRMDGTYREDFEEGGKNAKDRRYSVMFLGTNEFSWQVNTDLIPFNLEEIKKEVEAGQSAAKKNKALWEAYVIAAEGHDLAYFKELLANHEQAVQEDELAKEAKREEKAEKAKKAAKRKSTAGTEAEDVEMEDADETAASAKKAKPSKKRKKEAGSEAEEEKPAKTPKIKITQKKPASEVKKSKPAKEQLEAAQPEEPPMTAEEQLEKRKKTVLYLRHRLQKGFLTRNQAPKEEEMPNMADYLQQLEGMNDLEPEIIRSTKVHKVLKGIQKLGPIPRDEEFNIKQRSNDLLAKWSSVLSTDNDAADETAAPATNGVNPEEKKSELATASSEAVKSTDADGDVNMVDAKDTKEEGSATKTNGETTAESTADAAEATA